MRKYLKLSDGNNIPTLGLGTWKADKNLVGKAVRFAILEAGYTHIDCALIYENEPEIGEVFKEIFQKQVKRDEIFVTGKLWNTDHYPKDVEEAFKKTLKDLNIKYLDLYLMHWGIAFRRGDNLRPTDKNGLPILAKVSIQQTWQAMEGLVKKGLVKSIGVCNFTTMMIVDLLTYAKIKPVINQIEMHPYNTQEEILAFCKANSIALTAYSPLARTGTVDIKGLKLFEEPIIKKLAKKYKKTAAQILINWAISRGTIAIPKTVTYERLKENIDVFDFELTKKEQQEISSLNRNFRVVNPADWWSIPYFL